MVDKDIALMAHLMRRAGFGAPYRELEERAAAGYETTVKELLYPESQPELDPDNYHLLQQSFRLLAEEVGPRLRDLEYNDELFLEQSW